MDGGWSLIEFRPGRYVKVLSDGTVLGRATEAEVRAWFATLGWDLEGSRGEPTEATKTDDAEIRSEPEHEKVPPRPDEPPSPVAEASHPAPEPDVIEPAAPAVDAQPEIPALAETPPKSQAPLDRRGPREVLPEPEVLPARQLAIDLMSAPPSADLEDAIPLAPASGTREPVPEAPVETPAVTADQALDEPPLTVTEEPPEESDRVESPAQALLDRTAGAPDRAVWSAEPRASRAGIAIRRPGTPLAKEDVVDESDLEEQYGAPTADAADWWLWVDPRQERDYASSSFDLRAFLARAMDRFQEKPWAGGLRPARLAFHPGSAPDGIDAAAGELDLELIADPKVAPGTFMLGASDTRKVGGAG